MCSNVGRASSNHEAKELKYQHMGQAVGGDSTSRHTAKWNLGVLTTVGLLQVCISTDQGKMLDFQGSNWHFDGSPAIDCRYNLKVHEGRRK